MCLDTIMHTARYGTAFLEGLSSPRSKPLESDRFTARLFTRSTNWDPALRNANLWYDRYVAALRIMDRSERVQELAAINHDYKTLRAQVASTGWKSYMGPESRGEWFGDLLLGLMLPVIDKLQDAAERGEQDERNLHVAFALAAYHRDCGRYPAKLDELAPKYLEKSPTIYSLVNR